jgi:uncharacterized membrane protein SirB2
MALLVETGVATMIVTSLAVAVRRGTWLWEVSNGGDRIAWLIPAIIVAALLIASKEPRPWVKRFSIAFHVVFMLLVAAALTMFWIAPFPD